MTKEFMALIMAGTSLLGFLAFAAGGAWYMRGLEERTSKLESDDSRFVFIENRLANVEDRLDKIEARQDIDDNRWGKHFNLWGTEIRSTEIATGAAPTDFSTPTRDIVNSTSTPQPAVGRIPVPAVATPIVNPPVVSPPVTASPAIVPHIDDED